MRCLGALQTRAAACPIHASAYGMFPGLVLPPADRVKMMIRGFMPLAGGVGQVGVVMAEDSPRRAAAGNRIVTGVQHLYRLSTGLAERG